MFKVIGIEYLGYAAATTGGVSFIVKIEVPKDRFPSIDEGKAYLNIIVPIEEDEKLSCRIVSRLIDNGSISHWGEDEALTQEEHSIVQKWIEDNGIRKQALDIATEYKNQLKTFFSLSDDMEKIFEEKAETHEQRLDKRNRIEKVREKFDKVSARLDELQNMKVANT
ncbi:hypothetical protein COJ01_18060 [Priestia megaterium]|uniref:hypothetical protein n=1 Tax=Priestia megaterium TaxID=1404 RepID=UPI000BF4868E|nr:hypothetical protein [Priestia megaterium]PFK99949.1 hypothetical protein COJ01_18060 [Priestia megaterium]